MPTARIFQINISQGGVPKLALPTAEITTTGISGDRQRDLKHHGGPDRALCLYALDRILDLQTEGHPIFPGATGENLTLVGLNWDDVVPGCKLRLGDDVLIEVMSYTAPCATIRSNFLNEKPQRISQKQHPGWSRVYARVLEPGYITVGAVVTLLCD